MPLPLPLPLSLRRTWAREREERVEPLLSQMGPAEHAGQPPGEPSGGTASPPRGTALPKRPAILVATHDATLLGPADRVLELHDGEIVSH
ncbi:hypothetical protein SGPA1_11126 [Streptomyces misionensis JCM 4497]